MEWHHLFINYMEWHHLFIINYMEWHHLFLFNNQLHGMAPFIYSHGMAPFIYSSLRNWPYRDLRSQKANLEKTLHRQK